MVDAELFTKLMLSKPSENLVKTIAENADEIKKILESN